MNAPKKKHQEMILAFASAFLERNYDFPAEGVVKFPFNTFCEDVQDDLVIRQRAGLEKDPSCRQILPYTTVEKVNEDGKRLFFVYRRGKGVGESRLAGNASIGVGGHIDLTSVVKNIDSVINVHGTVFSSAHRELFEELELAGANKDPIGWRDCDLLVSDEFVLASHDVHAVHLGVMMKLTVPNHLELTCKEPELETIGFMTAEEALASGLPFELWSELYLKHVIAEENLAKTSE